MGQKSEVLEMKSANIIVLQDSFYPSNDTYQKLLKPYLDFLGFPYVEINKSDEIPDCALIIAGSGALSYDAVKRTVKGGTGLVCFANTESGSGAESVSIVRKHYITELHEENEVLPLYSPMKMDTDVSIDSGEVLLTCGEEPFVETAAFGDGKICLWHSMAWMSHEVFGPIRGMDDILWRSIVWAARKPFVMQGMPPMLGMRVDDVWGAWREMSPENPLLWVEIAQKFGIKPWLGIFTDNMDDISSEKVREYTHEGTATAFPHAFVGCEWVDTDLEEHWIYLNHSDGPYSNEQVRENAHRAKAWFDENGISMSKLALGHYYEMGSNALPYLKDWGCEFIGIHMNTDVSYLSGANWIKAGPYRQYEDGVLSVQRPVYYGDYVFDNQFFNCVTEIRDVCGYEWAPTSQVKFTIKNGIEQVRRALDSMCPAVLFTHESAWIQRMTPKTWTKSLEGITKAVANYEPEYLTMDEICKYARAKHDLCIKFAEVESENKLRLQLIGKNDMETKCYVFTDSQNGIAQKLVCLPQVDGEIEVTIEA